MRRMGGLTVSDPHVPARRKGFRRFAVPSDALSHITKSFPLVSQEKGEGFHQRIAVVFKRFRLKAYTLARRAGVPWQRTFYRRQGVGLYRERAFRAAPDTDERSTVPARPALSSSILIRHHSLHSVLCFSLPLNPLCGAGVFQRPVELPARLHFPRQFQSGSSFPVSARLRGHR